MKDNLNTASDITDREVLETDEDNAEDYTSDDGGIYPYSENVDLSKIEINLREEKISVYEIMRWTKKQKFVLDPDFQRSPNAWKPNKKSMFIESLILNLPLPHFYFNRDSSGRHVVIDGLQRLTAILDFFDDKFQLEGLKALPWLNGFSKSDLEKRYPEVLSKIEDKNIPYYSIMPSVPMAVTYDIFRRINTGGTKLERQEIRNCIFLGKSTKLLNRLAEDQVFIDVIDGGISSKRMKDREAILRCLAFSNKERLKEYKGDLDEYLGSTMKYINKLDDIEVEIIESRFIEVMSVIKNIFDTSAFRIKVNYNRGRINLAVMESIYGVFHNADLNSLSKKKMKILSSYDDLLANEDYLDSVRTSTNQVKKLFTRLDLANKYIGEQNVN
ncbi:hypothetical protein MACH09_10410 [Vibrio sp. MACH09]|uniref:GmrSD restriction endonuclease domain-containing protein n=1 Tax=Vibrio sp. MACH09 TaxID=3025122 RepID=UPI0027924141|nr:DUF262 domain-containing protein [Vibrio sp. MACH09]GLO60533.1 hypothetical protein MACH09_10410 [Vibrio sp. MACH09]